jgi:very-short-patch-repair endonuclease
MLPHNQLGIHAEESPSSESPSKEIYSEAKRMCRSIARAEAMRWSKLRGNRLEGLHFRRQPVLWGYIVAFFCCRAGNAVEADGGIHAGRHEANQIRDSTLTATVFAFYGLRTRR